MKYQCRGRRCLEIFLISTERLYFIIPTVGQLSNTGKYVDESKVESI